MKTRVCVLGIWHLGSVYSACLAESGNTVVGWDEDATKVAELNKGTPPIFEPGLAELLAKNIRAGNLSYTADFGSAMKGAKYILLTFDTPLDEKDEVDLSPIFLLVPELAKYMEKHSILVVSSQVPISTSESLKNMIMQQNPAAEFDIAYSPENLRLGKAIECFMNPERIVIGADSSSTLDRVENLFATINVPKVRMGLRSAEMVKHAINAFLGMSISFGNEIGNLCDELGADALDVMVALQTDGRIGNKLPLQPGLGFAGGTLARDLKILHNLGNKLAYEPILIDAILKVNSKQNSMIVKKIEGVYGKLDGLAIGVLGLTYKAGTSTLRRSAALEIIQELTSKGALVKAHDPRALLKEVQEHPGFQFCADPYEVSDGSDVLVIITDWPQFKGLDFDIIKSKMRKPVVIDAKNYLYKEGLENKGFIYLGIGRGRKQ